MILALISIIGIALFSLAFLVEGIRTKSRADYKAAIVMIIVDIACLMAYIYRMGDMTVVDEYGNPKEVSGCAAGVECNVLQRLYLDSERKANSLEDENKNLDRRNEELLEYIGELRRDISTLLILSDYSESFPEDALRIIKNHELDIDIGD